MNDFWNLMTLVFLAIAAVTSQRYRSCSQDEIHATGENILVCVESKTWKNYGENIEHHEQVCFPKNSSEEKCTIYDERVVSSAYYNSAYSYTSSSSSGLNGAEMSPQEQQEVRARVGQEVSNIGQRVHQEVANIQQQVAQETSAAQRAALMFRDSIFQNLGFGYNNRYFYDYSKNGNQDNDDKTGSTIPSPTEPTSTTNSPQPTTSEEKTTTLANPSDGKQIEEAETESSSRDTSNSTLGNVGIENTDEEIGNSTSSSINSTSDSNSTDTTPSIADDTKLSTATNLVQTSESIETNSVETSEPIGTTSDPTKPKDETTSTTNESILGTPTSEPRNTSTSSNESEYTTGMFTEAPIIPMGTSTQSPTTTGNPYENSTKFTTEPIGFQTAVSKEPTVGSTEISDESAQTPLNPDLENSSEALTTSNNPFQPMIDTSNESTNPIRPAENNTNSPQINVNKTNSQVSNVTSGSETLLLPKLFDSEAYNSSALSTDEGTMEYDPTDPNANTAAQYDPNGASSLEGISAIICSMVLVFISNFVTDL